MLLNTGDVLYFEDDTLEELAGHIEGFRAIKVQRGDAVPTAPSPFLIR